MSDRYKGLIQAWRHYHKDTTSPDSFIDMAFYFMISAALQRRVWLNGTEYEPIGNKVMFPNQYIILVAEPGIGKGLVIKPVTEFLQYHKYNPNAEQKKLLEDKTKAIVSPELIAQIQSQLYGSNADSVAKTSQSPGEMGVKYLFPAFANTTTFEKLVQVNAAAQRKIEYINAEGKVKRYLHCSLYGALEELGSLFRKHAEDVCTYLLSTYDCGDYEYATKNKSTDTVYKCCMSILAGTSPSFMSRVFSADLISEGFSSRTMFVFESVNRFEKFMPSEIDESQLKARSEIIAWLKLLSELHGQVKWAPDAAEFMTHYFEQVLPFKRENVSPKLKPWYARKNQHVPKLAMAIHFSRSLDKIITLDEAQLALELCNEIESKMHLALTFRGNNPYAHVVPKVTTYISNHPDGVTFAQIWEEFISDVRETELQEVLRLLQSRNTIVLKTHTWTTGNTTRTQERYFYAKQQSKL